MEAFTISLTIIFSLMAVVGLTGTLLSINRKNELDFLKRRIASQDAIILSLVSEHEKTYEEYQAVKKQANKELKKLKQRNEILIATDAGRRKKNATNND